MSLLFYVLHFLIPCYCENEAVVTVTSGTDNFSKIIHCFYFALNILAKNTKKIPTQCVNNTGKCFLQCEQTDSYPLTYRRSRIRINNLRIAY